jgi:hypothetical protein
MGSGIKPGTYKAYIAKGTVIFGPPDINETLIHQMWVMRVRKTYLDGTSRVLVNVSFSTWDKAMISGIAWVRHFRRLQAQRTA